MLADLIHQLLQTILRIILDITEIRRLSSEENIFGAPTQRRADQVCRTVLTRVQALDNSFYPIFLTGDLATQKLFALLL